VGLAWLTEKSKAKAAGQQELGTVERRQKKEDEKVVSESFSTGL